MSTTAVPTFAVGQTCTYSQLIDDKLVHAFADLTGDHNKIHVDDAFAKKTKFGQRIAHGGIMFGMISKVCGSYMPGLGTVYLSQLVNFHAPVFINDTVTLVVTISALLPSWCRSNDCTLKPTVPFSRPHRIAAGRTSPRGCQSWVSTSPRCAGRTPRW